MLTALPIDRDHAPDTHRLIHDAVDITVSLHSRRGTALRRGLSTGVALPWFGPCQSRGPARNRAARGACCTIAYDDPRGSSYNDRISSQDAYPTADIARPVTPATPRAHSQCCEDPTLARQTGAANAQLRNALATRVLNMARPAGWIRTHRFRCPRTPCGAVPMRNPHDGMKGWVRSKCLNRSCDDHPARLDERSG